MTMTTMGVTTATATAEVMGHQSPLPPPPPPLHSPNDVDSSPASLIEYVRYYYPLALFVFFIVSLTTWGIATSETSKPTPPPVRGVYGQNSSSNGRAVNNKRNGRTSSSSRSSRSSSSSSTSTSSSASSSRRSRRSNSRGGTGWFRRVAARFPGGIPQRKEVDEKRLGALRKALMNWLLAGVLLTLVANAANVIMHALTNRHWWCGKAYVVRTSLFVYLPSFFFSFSFFLFSLFFLFFHFLFFFSFLFSFFLSRG